MDRVLQEEVQQEAQEDKVNMATSIKAGIYQIPASDEQVTPEIYIDYSMIQVIDEYDNLVFQITYEELRGVMAIIAAEQEKTHLRIIAASKNN